MPERSNRKIQKIGIVLVVVLNDAKGSTFSKGTLWRRTYVHMSIPYTEESRRAESIRIMAEQFPQMLVGAGTVLTTEQVDRAVAAGANSS